MKEKLVGFKLVLSQDNRVLALEGDGTLNRLKDSYFGGNICKKYTNWVLHRIEDEDMIKDDDQAPMVLTCSFDEDTLKQIYQMVEKAKKEGIQKGMLTVLSKLQAS